MTENNPFSKVFVTEPGKSKIYFVVPCVPVSQPRQRHAIIGGHVRNFTPTTHPVNAFKASCKLAAAQAYSGAPFRGPVRMDVVFIFPRPQAKFWKTKPMPREWHFIKPDRDNAMKSLQDALNGLSYIDDCQLCAGDVQKWIASGDEQPHVEVTLTRLAV